MMWAVGILLIWTIVFASVATVAVLALPWPLLAMWALVAIVGHVVAALMLLPVKA